MKKQSFILLIEVTILIILLITTSFASASINVKDYIEGKFPVVFNIYLASLEELDDDEKEFIDLLEELPEEDQIKFAKEVYEAGFSKEMIDRVKKVEVLPETEIEPEEKITEKDMGKWMHQKKIDPINDDVIVYLVLRSDDYNARYEDYASLVLRWTNGRTELYINWNEYIGSDGAIVTYRVGDKKASKSTWAISTNGTATFYGKYGRAHSSKETIKFINELLEVDKFATQVEPYSESPVTAVFDVRGLENVIMQYNDTLEWIK